MLSSNMLLLNLILLIDVTFSTPTSPLHSKPRFRTSSGQFPLSLAHNQSDATISGLAIGYSRYASKRMNSPALDQPDILEAVYYSHAVPRNPEVLTNLGLIFDRVYFPGVYMPPPGFDRKALENEIQRIIAYLQGRLDPNTRQLLDC